jgi:hypothetical protein
LVLGLYIMALIVTFFALVNVVRRAGYSGWWTLLLFLPIINVLAIWYFGFARWPNQTDT